MSLSWRESLSQKKSEFDQETAKRCFNSAWDYLDKKVRDVNDERQMLHLAHTARYHWSLVEGPEKEQRTHLAVSDWQISRVYAALNQPELALHFARSALKIMQDSNLSGILHTGYEGMARAYATAKDKQSARDYVEKAREQLNNVASGLDAEDKKIYSDQISETEELIGK